MAVNEVVTEDETKLLTSGPIMVDVAGHYATIAGRDLDLTPTEFALLSILVQNPRRVLSAGRNSGPDAACESGCERAIDAHIKNLRAKLEDDPRHPQYIQTVYSVGYRFRAGA